jgi:hypothetical protein
MTTPKRPAPPPDLTYVSGGVARRWHLLSPSPAATRRQAGLRPNRTTFHRVELVRRGSAPLTFVALGLKPALAEALPGQATQNGVRC